MPAGSGPPVAAQVNGPVPPDTVKATDGYGVPRTPSGCIGALPITIGVSTTMPMARLPHCGTGYVKSQAATWKSACGPGGTEAAGVTVILPSGPSESPVGGVPS